MANTAFKNTATTQKGCIYRNTLKKKKKTENTFKNVSNISEDTVITQKKYNISQQNNNFRKQNQNDYISEKP